MYRCLFERQGPLRFVHAHVQSQNATVLKNSAETACDTSYAVYCLCISYLQGLPEPSMLWQISLTASMRMNTSPPAGRPPSLERVILTSSLPLLCPIEHTLTGHISNAHSRKQMADSYTAAELCDVLLLHTCVKNAMVQCGRVL